MTTRRNFLKTTALGAAATPLAAPAIAQSTIKWRLQTYAGPALAAHVIEHDADPLRPLSAMRRIARPDGRLWLIVSKPHWCNAIIWFQWRHRAYRPGDVALFLAETGWVLDAEYAFPTGPPSRTSRGYLARGI